MIDETKDSHVTDDVVDLVGTGDAAERQLTQMVAVLTAEFPDVPYEIIVGLTRQAAERYETATVRTFLPILVPKDVRALLCDGAYRSEVPAQAAAPLRGGSVLQLAVGSSS